MRHLVEFATDREQLLASNRESLRRYGEALLVVVSRDDEVAGAARVELGHKGGFVAGDVQARAKLIWSQESGLGEFSPPVVG